MVLERILKIYFLECITEHIFGKTNKKGERNRGKGTKVYIAIIYTMLFVALFVTCAKRVQGLWGTNFIIFIYRN